MRFFMKVSMPVEAGNEAAKKGRLGETVASILAEQKPEAAYFTTVDGQRTGLFFLDMSDASQLPALVEPWFLSFNATVEIRPVMTPDDLKKAGTHIEKAVKKYG
jgi:Domain of unknown function (DUF3303)